MKIKTISRFEYGGRIFNPGDVADVDADAYRHGIVFGYAVKVIDPAPQNTECTPVAPAAPVVQISPVAVEEVRADDETREIPAVEEPEKKPRGRPRRK